MNWDPQNIWWDLKRILTSPAAVKSVTSEASLRAHLRSSACPPYLSDNTSCQINSHLYTILEATVEIWQLQTQLRNRSYRPRGVPNLPVGSLSDPPAYLVDSTLTPATCPMCRDLPAHLRCSVVVSVRSLSDQVLEKLEGSIITAADAGDCIQPLVSALFADCRHILIFNLIRGPTTSPQNPEASIILPLVKTASICLAFAHALKFLRDVGRMWSICTTMSLESG